VQPHAQVVELKRAFEETHGVPCLQQRYYVESGELMDKWTAEKAGLGDGSCVQIVLSQCIALKFEGLCMSTNGGLQFDNNGALFFIGSRGGDCAYTNPHESGEVVARISSVQPRPNEDSRTIMRTRHGSVERFVMHSLVGVLVTRNFTKDEPMQWMSIDLGEERLLVPDHYCLRHGRGTSMFRLRNWRLEGSNDGTSWVSLKEHVNDHSLPVQAYGVAEWPLDGQEAYRYFRVLQTGLNSHGSHRMYCAGLELYGALFFEPDHMR
jgi:hypothetical protein